MKRFLSAIVLMTVLAALLAVPVRGTAAQSDGAGVERYLVLFEGTAVPADFAEQVASLGGSVDLAHDVGIAIVSGLADAAAAELGSREDISDIQLDDTFQIDPVLDAEMVEAVGVGSRNPGDPTAADFYPRQWNMRAIYADQAWVAGRLGSPAVTLAILDTGIDYTYPDLLGRVDLSRSASFVPLDDLLVSMYFPGKHPVTDLHYHGTHVASTAVSNAYFVAGVSTQTTLIGVKVCDVFGSCADSSIVQGILHAVDNGADVINMSLGGHFPKAKSDGLVGFINRLFSYANANGVVVVVSAGNDTIDLDHDGDSYSTCCSAPNVLCVSATAPTAAGGVDGPWTDVDAAAPYSNFGRSAISVAAPGGTPLPSNGGLVWAACSQTSLVVPLCQTGTYILGGYGTSMSSPHVSGLASLLVEDLGGKPGQIRARIQQTADDLGQRGTDPIYGKGRINVGEAVPDMKNGLPSN